MAFMPDRPQAHHRGLYQSRTLDGPPQHIQLVVSHILILGGLKIAEHM